MGQSGIDDMEIASYTSYRIRSAPADTSERKHTILS